MIGYSLISGFILILATLAENRKYLWKESNEWLPCSVTCGKGIQIRDLFCVMQVNNTFIKKSKEKCQYLIEPKMKVSSCFYSECPKNYEWKINQWSSCSHSCGHLGVKTRDVDCLDMNDDSVESIVDESLCSTQIKPVTRSVCNRVDCDPSLVAGDWGKCIVLEKCKPGKQGRKIKCSKILADGSVKIVGISQCYNRGLPVPHKIRQCFKQSLNDHCRRTFTPRKVKFNLINNNLYQMRRSGIVKLQIGQIGYLLPFSRVMVDCPIDDFPGEEIKWSHQNKMYKHEAKSSSRIRVDKNGKLRIKKLIFDDQGDWKCIADQSQKSVIIKIRSPSSGYRDWAIRSNLWKMGMLLEESEGFQNSEEVIHWVKSEWSVCSVTCLGDGSQYREVQCEKVKLKTYEILDDAQCESTLKSYPARIRTCHNTVKCPEWYFNQTTQIKCLPECIDIGISPSHMELKCIYLEQEVPLHMCDSTKQPLVKCKNDKCQLDWRLSPWSKCSESCGGVGIQARYITCVWKYSRQSAGSLCYNSKLPIPRVSRSCHTQPCRMSCMDLSPLCTGNSRNCYHGLYRHLCCLTCQKYFKTLHGTVKSTLKKS